MTKVTNIYIDTTGFTAERYAITERAIDELKTGSNRGWLGLEDPADKSYRVLTLDCDGNRGYYDNVSQMRKSPNSFGCQPVSLSDLVEMEMRANYEESLKLKKFRIIVDGKSADNSSQPITTIDRMTPEKERDIVCAVSSGLYSARLISTDAYRVISNSMADSAEANDTQP